MSELYARLALWLMTATKGSEQEYEIYKYGFQVGMEQGIFLVTSIMMALFLDSLGTMLLFLSVFYLVRPYVGGFHFKRFWQCYLLSVITAVVVVQLASNIALPIGVIGGFVVLLIGVTYACLSVQSKGLEVAEARYYRKKIRIHLGTIGIIAIVVGIANQVAMENVIMITLFVTNLSVLVTWGKLGITIERVGRNIRND